MEDILYKRWDTVMIYDGGGMIYEVMHSVSVVAFFCIKV